MNSRIGFLALHNCVSQLPNWSFYEMCLCISCWFSREPSLITGSMTQKDVSPEAPINKYACDLALDFCLLLDILWLTADQALESLRQEQVVDCSEMPYHPLSRTALGLLPPSHPSLGFSGDSGWRPWEPAEALAQQHGLGKVNVFQLSLSQLGYLHIPFIVSALNSQFPGIRVFYLFHEPIFCN